jgi:hypothetical protein
MTDSKERSGEKRSKMKWLKDILPSILVVLAAAILMYTNLGIAQKDIEDLETSDKAQNQILKKIPAMEQQLNSIGGTLLRIEGKLDKIAEGDKRMEVDNAKHHHKHKSN